MNIFKKIKDFFTPCMLATKVIVVPQFELHVMDRRRIEELRKNGSASNTWTHGFADIKNRIIYVEYDDKGIMPEFEVLGHEVAHLIWGTTFHK